MTKIYGYDTNVYETTIGNIKCFNESCSKEDIEKAMINKSFFEIVLEEKDKTINDLQTRWDSLREWLKGLIDNFEEDVSTPILHEQMTIRLVYEYMEGLDKMNEL